MATLFIEGTEKNPAVNFDDQKGIFEISGKSLSDDARGFYAPLIQWLEAYAVHPNASTELSLRFEYIDNNASKMLLDIFYVLQKIKGAHVTWYFVDDDEDMEEAGEEFAELAGVPFELKAH